MYSAISQFVGSDTYRTHDFGTFVMNVVESFASTKALHIAKEYFPIMCTDEGFFIVSRVKNNERKSMDQLSLADRVKTVKFQTLLSSCFRNP